MKESLRRRFDEKKRSRQSTDHAGKHEWNHDARGDVQLLGIGPAARSRSNAKSERIGRIGLDGGHAGEQQRRKRNETPSSRDGVNAASESSGKEQENGVVKIQVEVVSRFAACPPVRDYTDLRCMSLSELTASRRRNRASARNGGTAHMPCFVWIVITPLEAKIS